MKRLIPSVSYSASTFRVIIHNESYIGRKIWNKQDYQTTGVKWRDRSEWVITENAHPPLLMKSYLPLQKTVGRQAYRRRCNS
ncbi:recombinase family protein [Gorillibacterium timonense]|uniref:recombinase family protein n=1 Tax=Gorillibacterium timonense TaxID=1689269 RepID=UPI001F311650|nr:recombinase family protein [Gorillibacterium timonense]